MPTSDELRQASADLQALAEEVRGINPPVLAASGPDVLSGGNLGDSLAEFIRVQRVGGIAIAEDIDELARFAGAAAAVREALELEVAQNETIDATAT